MRPEFLQPNRLGNSAMTKTKSLASVVFALTLTTALQAETHCPGNVASVPLLLASHNQVIVGVSVNHAGPYNFLLDTGTEVTMLSPSLAAELHLNLQGKALVTGVGGVVFNATGSLAQLDLVEVGSHSVAHQRAVIYDFHNPHFSDLRVRGILGEDFLGQFDMLIDYAGGRLCLDDSAAMAEHIRGEHIALAVPHQAGSGRLRGMPIVPVRLSAGLRPLRLGLDSGMNVSFLFDTHQYLPLEFLRNLSLPGRGLDGAERSLATLPPQDLSIGSLDMPRVPFVTFARAQTDPSRPDFDGLLSTALFSRVFISHTDRFAVFDPW